MNNQQKLAQIKQLEQGLLSVLAMPKMAEVIKEEGEADAALDDAERPDSEALRQELEQRSGDDLRTVFGLASRFALSELECHILLIAFAPDLDPRNRLGFERISKLMAPDGRPTVGLVTHLLADDSERRLEVRAALGHHGSLRRFRLLDIIEHTGWAEADALVLPSPTVRDLLLGHGYPLAGRPVRGIAAESPENTVARLSTEPDRGDRVMIVGEQAPDRRATAAALAAAQDLSVLVRRIAPAETRAQEAAQVAALTRDALLHRAVPAAELDNIESRHLPELLTLLIGGQSHSGGSLLICVPHDLSGAIPEAAASCVTCEARAVDYDAIRRRWERGLVTAEVPMDTIDLDDLAGQFRMESWAIDAAIQRAQEQPGGAANPATLNDASRSLAGTRAVTHARRVKPRYRLEDMILPKQVRRHVSLLIGFAKQRERLLHHYGYAKRFTMGHGLIALLSGESGTGKTMAAEVLARALGRDLYVVDLSQLVSKWVGETEKHIDQVFSEAEQAHGVLLFDEADSLFSNRSGDVSSSNDRYANMEVGYLLQRIESFRGVAVLTTNLSQSIDDAFLRRFHFRIDVPRPTEDLRKELWRKMLPEAMRENDGLNFQTLARRFDLTGGNIRSALLKATYLADRDGSEISQDHLVEAATLECVELGRLI
ncbi:MAG: ATP-binding protein [Proteobacteria bacterium]|nr:ATP-binding protein [Pseudomonadota bacterium]